MEPRLTHETTMGSVDPSAASDPSAAIEPSAASNRYDSRADAPGALEATRAGASEGEDAPVDASEDAHGDDHEGADAGADVDAGGDDPAYGVGRDVPTAPATGDEVVDAAMIELAAAEAGSLAERIDAGEHAHRVLQGRLSDLGGA